MAHGIALVRKRSLGLPLLALLLAGVLPAAVAAQHTGGSDFAVYFPTGISTLSPAAKKSLDSLVYHGVIQPGQRLTVTGYADEPGTTSLNRSLSQRRAQEVASYLTQDGFIRKEDITAIIGQGYISAQAGRGNNPRFRRADISASDGPPPLARPVAPLPSPLPATSVPTSKPAPLVGLGTMKANSTLALDTVLFENNSDVVSPSSERQLEELLRAMQDNPSVRIRLEGHVCCGDSHLETPEHRQYISDIRAKPVYDYLIRNGINKSRLAYQGFGFSRPLVYPEKSEEDRGRNRRVEVRVLEK